MKHSTKRALIFLIFAINPTLCSVLLAQEAPSNFRILDIKTKGDGCRPGTVGQNISSDQLAFTVTFSELVADLSATSSKRDEMKSCRLVFDTEQDEGWAFSVIGIIFRGASYLEPGVDGQLSVSYGAQGRAGTSTMNLKGPLDEPYVFADQVSIDGLKWNGCGRGNGRIERVRDFVLDSQIQLHGQDPGSRGYFTVDSTDGEVAQTYDLLWRRCDGRGPKNLAVCRIEDKNQAGASRALIAVGKGATAQDALEKAKKRLARRCAKEGKSLPRCDSNAAQCRSLSL